MALSIVSNVASLNAQRNLSKTQGALQANMGRLSSGLRINTAADDAAGLAVSETMKAQIRSYAQAERNANDGISLLQTAEGGTNEMSGVLIRMRELAMQSSTGTLSDPQRALLDAEFQQLSTEIGRISTSTQFNGVALLDGSTATVDFQIGKDSGEVITATLQDLSAAGFGASGTDLTALAVDTAANAQASLADIDTALDDLGIARSTMGSVQSRLQVTVANLGSMRENLSAANSRIRDVDVAEESAAMTRNNILSQAGVAVLAQANQMPQLALKLLG